MGCGVEVGETLETQPFIKPGWVSQSRWATLKLQTPWPPGKLILTQSACWNPCGCPALASFLHSILPGAAETKDTQKLVQKVKESSLYGS